MSVVRPPDSRSALYESGQFPMHRSQLLDILAAIAGMLSRGGPVDIDATLRSIGEAVGVDRMYLFESSVDVETGRSLCSQRFEWASGSVTAEIDNPEMQNLPYEDVSDVLEETLRRGDVFGGIRATLEAKTRRILESQGILSFCLVPVITDEQLWGFVGFDDCHSERVWTDDEISVLRLIAAGLGGYHWRERMRGALTASEAQYRYLVDNVNEVIFETDGQGRITFLNRAWEKYLGIRTDVSVGRPLLDYVAPQHHEAMREALRGGGLCDGVFHEARFVTRDGDERWGQLFCRFTKDEAGAVVGVLGTITDVTEHRWAEEALRRQQLDESLSTLAGGIAHDFNNVLHGMLTAAGILGRRYADEAGAVELLSIIQTGGERMADMTRQLLAYSRGGIHETTLLDPAQLVEDALKIGRARVPPDVHLTVTASVRGACVLGDRGQLFQVVLNLIVNAVEAMEHGGALSIGVEPVDLAREDVLVRERRLAAGSYVRFSFADRGEGIDPEVMPRIFEPFFSTKAHGRGLGLAAARGIIVSHGGAISVESARDEGSTFHVLLPRSTNEGVSVHAPMPLSKARGLVLIVDDEESIVRVTEESLTEAGYRVLVARRASRALELVEEHAAELDAVVVDYLMPDMNGATLIRAVRAISPRLKLVLATGYDRDGAAAPGLDDVPRLQKPFPISELLALLAGEPR